MQINVLRFTREYDTPSILMRHLYVALLFASQEINDIFKQVTVLLQGRLSVTSIPASRSRNPFHFTADLDVKVVWEHGVFLPVEGFSAQTWAC